jgi:hypothetical protein
LGAADFLEFLGAFLILTIINMGIRIYILPVYKFCQEFLEEKIEHFIKNYKK